MKREIIKSLYSPDEIAILDKWFNVPSCDRNDDINVCDSLDRLNCGGSLPCLYDFTAAAVAKILLSSVERTLPDWIAVKSGGEIISARKSAGKPYKPVRVIALLPQFLFSINWADSGPGFSWPMAYHVTWVPGYDWFVVTSSSDSPEGNHGYCDLALDSIGKDEDPLTSAGTIIQDDWHGQYVEWDQQPWAYVLDANLIAEGVVEDMGRSVWEHEEILEY